MRVIVLAAGFATRLYPLTKDRAKPLLEVGGRPVLTRLLDRVRVSLLGSWAGTRPTRSVSPLLMTSTGSTTGITDAK